MKNGKNELQNSQHEKKRIFNKIQLLILSLLVVTTVTVGGTVAYLTTNTESVVNTFEPSHVRCTVHEDFDGTVKSNVKVENTSDIEAYIRVKLVSYRVNGDEDHRIGGTADISFTVPDGWLAKDGYYYYTRPVAAGGNTSNLIDSLTLKSYTDADGGRQVIEVMAEAIQSKPVSAVQDSWNVTISDGIITN